MKNRVINVSDINVSICELNDDDYISLTDMLKAKDGNFFIEHWLRNRNTIEFLGIWESINNPNFNYVEFDAIRKEAGLNSFKLSAKEWSEKTKGIGICAKTGRYGGTYAHRDIAFEFGSWISPHFKLYLIKEFQRLKEEESNIHHIEWNFRRVLAATNYKIHTEAIKESLIPWAYMNNIPDQVVYADEAELINFALFGITSKKWRETYPAETSVCKNLRYCADTNQLIVLSNLESLNASLIRQGFEKEKRLSILQTEALSQLKSLNKLTKTYDHIESPNKKKLSENKEVPLIENREHTNTSFGNLLGAVSRAGKPEK